MKTWFHEDLVKAIQETTVRHSKKSGPQLCYEQVLEDPKPIIEAIVNLTDQWLDKILGCFVYFDNNLLFGAITSKEIQEILLGAIKTEKVTSIFNFSLTGGFSLDFSPCDNGGFEVLYTAWGKYESDASELAKMFGGETWRGN